jgi:hypothetical protein
MRDRKTWPRGFKQAESFDAMKAEIAHLKAEFKRTAEERNILRKTDAYFAKASE